VEYKAKHSWLSNNKAGLLAVLWAVSVWFAGFMVEL
jgi:hypothetical protein